MKRNTKELINMLAAALLVLATLLLALGVHACRNSDSAREKRARTLHGNTPETETHTLALSGIAPLPLPTASAPLSRDTLGKVADTLVILAPTLDGAEPVFSASPGLFISPALLSPLCELAAAFHRARPAEALYVGAAFTPDATSPFATGYAVSLSVRRGGETLPLATLPDAAAYLAAERARYGFIALEGDGSDLYFVGYPHATLMEERHLTPMQYLTYLSLFSMEEPLCARIYDRSYRIFYLPAEDGKAALTLPRDTPFSLCQVASAGFIIVLPGAT